MAVDGIVAGVTFDGAHDVGLHAVLGHPPRGVREGELPLVIGADAVIRSHTVLYAGSCMGAGFQTGHHVTVREFCVLGNNVSIGTSSVIEHHVRMDDGVRVHSRAFVPEWSHLREGSWVGPGVIVTNALHPLCPEVGRCLKGVDLGAHAKIGAGAVIAPDVKIGAWALVGAGAVVTRDVPERAVVVGNPARVVKTVDDLTCPYDIIDFPYPRADGAVFPPSPTREGNPPARPEFPDG